MSESEHESASVAEPVGEGVAESAELAAAEAKYKLSLKVDVTDVGPCKKRVQVVVPRADIDHFYNEAIKELVGSATVPGFRPGHVPRKLIERRFRKEVGDTVRQQVLMESLEQLAEEHELDAINEPNLDVEDLEIPEQGDFSYDFEVEVRPEFDLPDYNGLRIRRPVRTVTDDEVHEYVNEYLEQFGQVVPHDGPAEAGDFLTVDLSFESPKWHFRHLSDLNVRVRPVLEFTDATIKDFGDKTVGATPGATFEFSTTISAEAAQTAMRGEPVVARFVVRDVKRLRMPELNDEFLSSLGVEDAKSLNESARRILERQVVYEQRQATRRQVLSQITVSATWDLPESLVSRQVQNALHRELLEMRQAGFNEEYIASRENELRQEQVSMTRQALKEHFVLNKIATQAKLEVTPDDIEEEIHAMAQQRGESSRKMRVRLARQDLMENLEAQILERKAVDYVLERAVFEDETVSPRSVNLAFALGTSICALADAQPTPVNAPPPVTGAPAAAAGIETAQG